MINYRPFRNSDPPHISAIWQSRALQLGLSPEVSPDLFEQLVFAKTYFDYSGLIMAFEDEKPVGFAHAGFGPGEQPYRLSCELGTTCLLMVRPGNSEEEIAAGLLEQCENYLRTRGAKVFYGGGMNPLYPFYLGLYGGSELPGLLDADALSRRTFEKRGYREIERTHILHLDLTQFESVIDRQQMQIRRQMVVESQIDAPTRSWWEACTLGEFELTRYEMVPRGGGHVVATALFRNMDPCGTNALGRTSGLLHVEVDQAHRGRGYAIFLLSEAFRQFQKQGIVTVEAQTPETNLPAVHIYQKLKFQKIGGGGIFRKNG